MEHGRATEPDEQRRRDRATGSVPRHPVLRLQAAAGNAAVSALMVQRDLAGYTREHLEVEPMMGEGPPIFETTTADGPALTAALAGLVAAGKVGTRTVRDLVQFFGTGATNAEISAALTAAGLPRSAEMAAELLNDRHVALYSRENRTYIPGLIWDTELAKRSNNVDAQTSRGLTNAEMAAARTVYGGSLPYDDIRLEEAPVMSAGGYARTTPWAINLPVGDLTTSPVDLGLLIHELAHSWQYARGVSMATTAYHAVRAVYDYGGEAELARRTAAGQGLSSFNTEQQGDIAQHAWEIAVGRRTGTAAVYAPYVAEFSSGAYK